MSTEADGECLAALTASTTTSTHRLLTVYQKWQNKYTLRFFSSSLPHQLHDAIRFQVQYFADDSFNFTKGVVPTASTSFPETYSALRHPLIFLLRTFWLIDAGGDRFFTELHKVAEDGSIEWESDGGVATYNPTVYETQRITITTGSTGR